MVKRTKSQIGKANRRKGGDVERQVAKILQGERIPLSGAAGGSFKGDIRALNRTWEVKHRKDGFRLIYAWLGENDGLVIKANYKNPLVVMDIYEFKKILNEAFDEGKRSDRNER